ncbi:MAG: NAD(P)-binding domain-containing protein [Acidobacteriota bacterium]|nr:NAD(P)-binding domain-containing protein [Acidobacteriota bacterium]MDQ5872174.1 NAD(P)-binding domain-containing protein [Acidobacteriota bacterium]
MSLIRRYIHWLHTRWPAGTVEKLPEIREDGTTAVAGVRIVGDLTGIPLLKFSSDSGAKAVKAILAEPGFAAGRDAAGETLDVAIVGGGVSGIAAAIAAKKAGLSFRVFEASEVFSTVANFPKGKPIYTYPTGMTPEGDLQFRSEVHPKEELLRDLETRRRAAGVAVTLARIERIERKGGVLLLHQGDKKTVYQARRAIVAIGRSGNHRRLGVPGEDSGKVYNRLYDPKEFAGRQALVVGGGDSALETAIALGSAGAHVTLSYRKKEFSRPKPENVAKIRALEKNPLAPVAIEEPSSERVTTATGAFMKAAGDHKPGSVKLALGTQVVRIEAENVALKDDAGVETTLPNDVVFTMLGREAPLEFFRRSGIPIRGEWKPATWIAFAVFFLLCVLLFNWKAGGDLNRYFQEHRLFPYNIEARSNPSTLAGTLAISMRDPGFYYSIAYCLAVLLFGIQRIRRRRTPYVTLQTTALTAIQLVPLFLLPFLVLPLLGHNGAFDAGFGKTFADNLFPAADAGHGREYWRAFGFILAWPLFIWNVFSPRPLAWWLMIAFVQTFVLIPLIIRRWGKGAYCGWICSCGALAETMGDAHRQKMPHGPIWNRVNMTGQVILAAAFLLFIGRAVSWTWPDTRVGQVAGKFYDGLLSGWSVFGVQLNYYYLVDVFLAGIVGVGLYFWFSGRVWCRFACPLAALMNVYTRFSRFRIFAEKEKCISCNVCTSVCHQGIDVMNFANKGLPMEDPQCVRCSACVQACPTGVLAFGRYAANGLPVLDRIGASPVRMTEGRRVSTPSSL